MKIHQKLTVAICRVSAFALFAASSTMCLNAQQNANGQQNVMVAELNQPALFSLPALASSSSTEAAAVASAPLNLTDDGIAYSSSVGASELTAAENFTGAASMQPPPRRRYGRPRYTDSSHNADGSNKWTFEAGGGLTIPTGNSHKYLTPSYAFQVGAGRNFNKNLGLLLQFDYDHFGFQGSTIAQQNFFYGTNGQGLDGSTHVWSFTLDPIYNINSPSETVGAYVIGGVGFYHKVANFTIPGEECDYYYGICYTANEPFDDYSSNAVGVNGGFGLTYKFSRFADERFFMEARYVFMDNSPRAGITMANYQTYAGYNYFPQNSHRTTYIPIKFGVRF
jgi:hypothetical protein